MMAQTAGNVSTSPITGHRNKVCKCSSIFFAHFIFEYRKFRKSPNWYEPSHTKDAKSKMAVVPSSIGAVVNCEFESEEKAEVVRTFPGSDIMSELMIPSSFIESEKSGKM